MEPLTLPPSPPMDLHAPPSINYLSAPSSPRRFAHCFFSAPTSPTRITEFYRQFDDFSTAMERSHSRRSTSSVSSVPFDWEETPGTPKKAAPATDEFDFGFDFAFDVSVESDATSRTAEELFDGGKIRPLKPPPRLQFSGSDEQLSLKSPLISSPRSPRSPIAQGKKFLREAFSPRRRKQSDDPFAAAEKTEQNRGRSQDFSGSSSGRRAARSLSPFRVSEFSWEQEAQQKQQTSTLSNEKAGSSSTASTSLSSSSSKGSFRKWSFKDFLLFRSASEGRASEKDRLRKYCSLFKKQEDVKNESFRSTGSSVGKRKGRVSAHELHYTANKAASEDLKKKTFLPYKQGILGRFAFSPAGHRFGR